MTLELDTMPRKLAVVCVVALATTALSFPLWAHYRASHFSEMGNQAGLERAVALQPRNAELHNRLGRLLMYTPLGDPAASLHELEQATQLDPRSGQYWMDLALAHEIRGNLTAATHAIAKARAAEPRTPAMLWFEANYLVRRGDEAAALDRLKELLAQSPEYTVRALAFFARVADPGVLIEQAVPRRRDALDGAIEFVRREQLLGSAPELWRAVRTLPEAPSEVQLRLFVDWLIAAQQVPLATEVWRESAQRGWLPIEASTSGAALYNAGFEQPLQNFGFDWRVVPHPEATAWIEARGPAAGLQSLCIQFGDEARGTYAHVMHAVALEPNTTYSLKAALRSDRLMSRTGALMTITTFDNVELARTDSVTGTSSWKEVSTVLQSGSQPRFVLVRLMRPAPAKGDEAATGLACVADVRWTPLGPASAAGGAAR